MSKNHQIQQSRGDYAPTQQRRGHRYPNFGSTPPDGMMQSQQILHGDQAREVESFMGHITPQPRGQDQTNPKIYREKARFYGVDHASLKQTPLGTSIPCLKKSQTRDILGTTS